MGIKFNLKTNFNISKVSWLGVGGVCDVLFKPKNEEELVNFLHVNTEKITVLGNTSNVIIGDDGIRGVTIRLAGDFTKINHINEAQVEVGAGMLDKQLSLLLAEEEIGGLEFLSTIPGNIGGGVKMNCGCFGGEIAENLVSIQGYTFKGEKVILSANEVKFEYRKAHIPEDIIITSAVLRGVKSKKNAIIEKMLVNAEAREKSQPTGGRTLGSTFKNPKEEKAWKLLEIAGLRGVKIGGASFSSKHLNFLINDGTATAKDVLNLIQLAQKLVLEKCNIYLEPEVKTI